MEVVMRSCGVLGIAARSHFGRVVRGPFCPPSSVGGGGRRAQFFGSSLVGRWGRGGQDRILSPSSRKGRRPRVLFSRKGLRPR
eukprot:3433609-Pyramimonas_sp.AAC.1